MRTIHVTVTGEFISKDNKNGGVQGEANATQLHIVFDNTWSGYGKRVIWRDAYGENPVAVVLTPTVEGLIDGDTLAFDTPIPSEPLKHPGWCSFTIDGYQNGDPSQIALTVSDTLKVYPNDTDYQPGEPTPTQAQQIMAAIEAIVPGMQEIATEAKSWAVGGTGSREGEDTDNAKYYSGQAKNCSDDARESAGNASQSAGNAAASASAASSSAGAAKAAQTAAETAQGKAEDAQSAAEAAQAAAGSASSAAQSAKAAAEAAQGKAEAAQGKAEAAQTGAEEAQSAAAVSQAAAELAKREAITAQKAAEAAKTAAQTAQGKAETAQAGAEAAREGAETARQAIENLGVSSVTGEPGTEAAVKKTVSEAGAVNLEFTIPQGVQGKTGETGAQGIGIQSIERTAGTGAPGTTDTYTIAMTDGSTSLFTVYNGANGAGSGDFMADGSVPMAGALQMDGNRVTGLGAPTTGTDGARLQDVTAENAGAVPVTRKINSKALSADVTLSAGDVGAVPTTRKVNNKALTADITLTATDVSAVPTTRKINNKPLSSDVTLTASDVGAIPAGQSGFVSHSEEGLGAVLPVDADTLGGVGPDGYVPAGRTVNGKPLDADITLTAGDVGAATTATYTTTIPASGWNGSGPYTVAVTVSGILASDNPIVDIVQTGTESTDEAIRENWGKINRITTASGSITVYASEVPTVNIPIQLKVVR